MAVQSECVQVGELLRPSPVSNGLHCIMVHCVCDTSWFICFPHQLREKKQYLFPFLLLLFFHGFFFCFVIVGKCVFNGKWKTDEKFKGWIVADPTSKTKAICVVCNEAVDISSTREALCKAT